MKKKKKNTESLHFDCMWRASDYIVDYGQQCRTFCCNIRSWASSHSPNAIQSNERTIIIIIKSAILGSVVFVCGWGYLFPFHCVWTNGFPYSTMSCVCTGLSTGSTLNQRWSDMRVSVCSLRVRLIEYFEIEWNWTNERTKGNEKKNKKQIISTTITLIDIVQKFTVKAHHIVAALTHDHISAHI